MSKHYQNDYKKLLGIDQSRTAAEKALDRQLSRRQAPLGKAGRDGEGQGEVQGQPRKIVKRQVGEEGRGQVKSEDAINKIIKCLKARVSLPKMHKSLQILKKILTLPSQTLNLQQQRQPQQPPTTNTTTISIHQLKQLTKTLTHDATSLNIGSLGQMIKFAECQNQVLEMLVTLLTKQQQKMRSKQKEEEEKKEKEGGEKDLDLLIAQIGLEIQLLKLITDDNFIFSKCIANLKASIFAIYQSPTQPQPSSHNPTITITPHLKPHMEAHLLPKLLTLPNLGQQPFHSTLTSMLASFISTHSHQLTNRKHFLSEYNKLIANKNQSKKDEVRRAGKADGIASGRGLGAGGSGGVYTVVERAGDGGHVWVNRQ